MDCILFEWDTARAESERIVAFGDAQEIVRTYLKRAYPLVRDRQFFDLIQALDRPGNDG